MDSRSVAILRNLAAIKNIKSKVLEWTLIVLGVALGIVFNDRTLKIAFILNMLFFVAFSVAIKNYVGTVGNIVVAVTTAIALYREKTAQRREEPDND